MIQVFPQLYWVDDLLDIEGIPLITYFKGEKNFLRCWHDREDDTDTWLYFEISDTDLSGFKTNKISLLTIWEHATSIVREITDENGQHLSFDWISLSDISPDVYPSKDSFLQQDE